MQVWSNRQVVRNESLAKAAWQFAEILQDGLQSYGPEVIARFVATRGPEGHVAIDDVQVMCGTCVMAAVWEYCVFCLPARLPAANQQACVLGRRLPPYSDTDDGQKKYSVIGPPPGLLICCCNYCWQNPGDDREEGVCECMQGYTNQPVAPGVPFNCVLDAGEVLPPQPTEPESRCRANAGCKISLACEMGPADPVCGGGTTLYKSLDCARCAYESDIFKGVCRSMAADDDVVSVCHGTTTEAQRYVDLCTSGGRSVQCMNGKNYANKWCGLCNDVPAEAGTINGYCSGVVSAQGEVVIDECPRGHPATKQCLESMPFVVCGSDGKQYKNSVW